ncbi:MAG: CehA/McbA family metallohydrolase, partial [Pirellulales bacterium]
AARADGQVRIFCVDTGTGQEVPFRMHLRNAAGKPPKVRLTPFFNDHYAFPGSVTLKLARGNYSFQIERGPEYPVISGYFTMNDFADDEKKVELKRIVDMAEKGWWSGDLDVRRPLKDVPLLMQADDLHLAEVFPAVGAAVPGQGPKNPPVQFDMNRYYRLAAGEDTSAGGQVLFFDPRNDAGPAIAFFRRNDPAAEYPSSLDTLSRVRRENLWCDAAKPYSWDLPAWLAAGRLDSIELANADLRRDAMVKNEAGGKPRDVGRLPNPWGHGLWSQEIYYHALNCGLRLPPTAGSGSGVAPNPVGYNRVYVFVGDEFSYEKWFAGLRAGRVVVTNGPLMRPLVNGKLPGHVFKAEAGTTLELTVSLELSTRDPIQYLELVKNGQVERSVRLDEYAKTGSLPPLKFTQSGWFLVRAVTDLTKTYRFATTGPYYVEVGEQRRISKKSVQFFLDWVTERARGLTIDDPDKRREVLEYHRQARDFWRDLGTRANAE